MIKYYRILYVNKYLYSESIVSLIGLQKLESLLDQKLEVEVVYKENFSDKDWNYYYVPTSDIDSNNWGEKNVFYDHLGNEWRN